MHIAIVGAGASGMIAAIAAARENPAAQITIFEKQPRAGKKLLATGNGRCNLTNKTIDGRFYHGSGKPLAEKILNAFGAEETLRFFRSVGLLEAVQSDGRVYPFSDRANSVLDVLRMALETHGVTLMCGSTVQNARFKKGRFVLDVACGDKTQVFFADRLIVCAGGLAAPKLGGTQDGYRILESFGHQKTKLFPSLTRLLTDPEYPRALKGIRADAEIRVERAGETLAVSAGEIQFTESGVSGPAAFEVSRCASTQRNCDTVALDLCRGLSEEMLIDCLMRRKRAFAAAPYEEIFTGILHNRLGKMLVRYAGIFGQKPCTSLTKEDAKALCSAAKHFRLPLRGTADFADAQVTAGGIACDLFSETLESMLCPGLYAAGEVLDVDGDCGGYNLQWAWASGYTAGKSAARENLRKDVCQ